MYNAREEKLITSYFQRDVIGNVVVNGNEGVGKKRLVNHLIKSRLCVNSDGFKRGCQCDSCRRFDKSMHPDYIFISAEKNTIKKQQVVELRGKLSTPTVISDERFIVIDDAQLMTVEAQNSLLKNTEMTGSNKFIFITNGKILDTLLSRSTVFKLRGLEYVSFREQFKSLDDACVSIMYAATSGSVGRTIAISKSNYYSNFIQAVSSLVTGYYAHDTKSVFTLFGLLDEKNKKGFEAVCGDTPKELLEVIKVFLGDLLRVKNGIDTVLPIPEKDEQIPPVTVISYELKKLTTITESKREPERQELMIVLYDLIAMKEA